MTFTFWLNSMMHTILIKAVRSKLSTAITSDVKLYVWYGLLPPNNTLPSGKSAAVQWYVLEAHERISDLILKLRDSEGIQRAGAFKREWLAKHRLLSHCPDSELLSMYIVLN
nr:hypothetical protein CFP56_59118 [Quercus suber]